MIEREHILEEIRRLAALHDGQAPGIKRFTAGTGIAEHEWRGRHWATWSDALGEAGFQPNEWRTAYSEEEVLDRLIALIDDMGRFPTKAERGLARRADPLLPSEGVFRRLGRKAEIAAKVVARCDGLGKWPTVRAIAAKHIVQPDSSSGEPPFNPEIGEVYLFKSGRYYKIGYSNAPGRRRYEVERHRPEGVTEVHTIRTDDPLGVEHYWHRRFADRRVRDEWFDLSPDDVQAFKRWKRIV